ncbi:hypothetical protein [Psychrobacillus sp. L3]|uniref:hypothetical protein n=1 Tax=Psychrobacillus sp. L3 TaxID=3236891 RepID=UPI0036F35E19
MNIDTLELFDGVKNVEFTELAYCEGENAELLVFTLKEETTEAWNAKARKLNTKTFIEAFGNSPENYDEVLSWIHSLKEKEVPTAV